MAIQLITHGKAFNAYFITYCSLKNLGKKSVGERTVNINTNNSNKLIVEVGCGC